MISEHIFSQCPGRFMELHSVNHIKITEIAPTRESRQRSLYLHTPDRSPASPPRSHFNYFVRKSAEGNENVCMFPFIIVMLLTSLTFLQSGPLNHLQKMRRKMTSLLKSSVQRSNDGKLDGNATSLFCVWTWGRLHSMLSAPPFFSSWEIL